MSSLQITYDSQQKTIKGKTLRESEGKMERPRGSQAKKDRRMREEAKTE